MNPLARLKMIKKGVKVYEKGNVILQSIGDTDFTITRIPVETKTEGVGSIPLLSGGAKRESKYHYLLTVSKDGKVISSNIWRDIPNIGERIEQVRTTVAATNDTATDNIKLATVKGKKIIWYSDDKVWETK